MKVFLYITLSLVVLFFITMAFISKSTRDTEQHKYVVLKSFDEFEVRQYEAALFSSVKLNADTYDKVSGTGFRMLAGYIFGGNETNEKIAMTSPVTMEIDDSSKMSFMVPAGIDIENLPTPNNKQIYFEQKEEKIIAAISFGGWADDEKIEKYKLKLIAELAKNNLSHTGKFAYFGYNPPFEVINRRNEVAVELTNFTK
ncbi:MAG: heme-binding protein [Crocinitomicaceae bacterium]|nr:heme-binding protein [Crocinitomicaceae bacterium]MDP5010260.1 heme-binding protein [Crocinitomicaceae bacterium]MDP5099004.1 heme-binding protein [Crocinitomicaceae bacterium]